MEKQYIFAMSKNKNRIDIQVNIRGLIIKGFVFQDS